MPSPALTTESQVKQHLYTVKAPNPKGCCLSTHGDMTVACQQGQQCGASCWVTSIGAPWSFTAMQGHLINDRVYAIKDGSHWQCTLAAASLEAEKCLARKNWGQMASKIRT